MRLYLTFLAPFAPKTLESKALKRAESFSLSTAAMRLEQILKE